jgi:Fe-S cluster assembly scaffold protein SufB
MMNNVPWIGRPVCSNNIQENIRKGIIFMSISEAIKEHPELVRKYLGTTVPQKKTTTMLP